MFQRSSSLALLVFSTVFFLAILAPPSSADIPQIISYQGKVTDTGGAPVADGTYTMRFRIYDDETGNIPVWDSGVRSIDLIGGIFSVNLGDTSVNPIDLPFDTSYWLLVTVEGDDQTPRKPLTSVGYAYMSSGLVPGTEVTGDVTTGTASAFKGVNTSTIGVTYGLRGVSNSTAGIGSYGEASASTGYTYGGRFQSASVSGTGIYGFASSSAGETYGVHGSSSSSAGRGVYGFVCSSMGSTYGVYGESASTSGTGIRGDATALGGITYGGNFQSASTSGTGVRGFASASTGFTNGGRFMNASSDGKGVSGYAMATSGTTYGVYGESSSGNGIGVSGYVSATCGDTYGIYGETASMEGIAVSGKATAQSGSTFGGVFESYSSEGRGVCGLAASNAGETYGVMGITNSTTMHSAGVFGSATQASAGNYGVYGKTESDYGYGVYGEGGKHGVHGKTDGNFGAGIYGSCAAPDSGFGVYGIASSPHGTGVMGLASNIAGYGCGVIGETRAIYHDGFGVYYVGGLAGSGTKSCVVKTSQGPTLMYCQESPENWFEDFGEGRLVNGRARIDLDPLFLETVTIDGPNPMKVFVELRGKCEGIYVEKGLRGFEVIELHDGRSNAAFDFRVVAKRKGFEEKRMDYCRVAETDSYLYSNPGAKELRRLQQNNR